MKFDFAPLQPTVLLVCNVLPYPSDFNLDMYRGIVLVVLYDGAVERLWVSFNQQ
jgi:hypothetical protein